MHQVLSQLIYEARNPQTDAPHLRQVLHKIGEILAMTVMQELDVREAFIETPTGTSAKHDLMSEEPVLVTILRGGLLLNSGVHSVFSKAEVGFLGISRDEKTLAPKTDYVALPDLQHKTVIIVDVAVASGGTLIDAIKVVKQGHPRRIIVICALASSVGIERLCEYDSTVKIYAAAIDPEVNEKGFIVPGFGNVGNRSYGFKRITKAANRV